MPYWEIALILIIISLIVSWFFAVKERDRENAETEAERRWRNWETNPEGEDTNDR